MSMGVSRAYLWLQVNVFTFSISPNVCTLASFIWVLASYAWVLSECSPPKIHWSHRFATFTPVLDSDILQHAILSLCYCRLGPNLCRFFNSNVTKGKGSVLSLLHISHVQQLTQYHFGDEVSEWTSIAILNGKVNMDWACDPATSVHEFSRRDVCNGSLLQLAALRAISRVVSDRSITCRQGWQWAERSRALLRAYERAETLSRSWATSEGPASLAEHRAENWIARLGSARSWLQLLMLWGMGIWVVGSIALSSTMG